MLISKKVEVAASAFLFVIVIFKTFLSKNWP